MVGKVVNLRHEEGGNGWLREGLRMDKRTAHDGCRALLVLKEGGTEVSLVFFKKGRDILFDHFNCLAWGQRNFATCGS